MKKLLLVIVSFLMVFSFDAFAKVVVTKASSAKNPLYNVVFGAPANISVHPSNLTVNQTSVTDIWYINCKTKGTTDLWIQIEGDLLSLGIARGPNSPDLIFEVYTDQRVHFVGTFTATDGTVLIVAARNGSLIKASSDDARVKVEAVKKWGSQVYSVTVNRPTLSQNIVFELSTTPAQSVVCSWPGTYFSFTSFGYRELLEGGLLVVNVFNVPLAPPKSGEMPVFVNLGSVRMANPSQATTWGLLKKGDSK